jgi:DNA-binding beta-propeller fold protein YncE
MNDAPVSRPPTPDRNAESAALRALASRTPVLPFERVELKIAPALRLGVISASAADAQGNIHVYHRPRKETLQDPVVVIDSTGGVLRTFGKGRDPMPHGIEIDAGGNLWTADANTSTVRKLTPEGKTLLEVSLGDLPLPDKLFRGAIGVAFRKDGRFYVGDGYWNARVVEYSSDGMRLREWGRKGGGPGEFNLVHDISTAADGTVYIADRENGRAQWFDPDGRYLGEKHFGGQLYSVAVAPDGMLYAGTHDRVTGADRVPDNIYKLDPKSGNIIGRIEIFAHQLTVGRDGSLYPGTASTKIGDDPDTTSIVVFRPRGT